jgi:hypothetical protein
MLKWYCDERELKSLQRNSRTAFLEEVISRDRNKLTKGGIRNGYLR